MREPDRDNEDREAQPAALAVSPALFGLVCLAFLLPFATVSCGPEETTFTGAQLATWTVPPGSQGGLADEVESSGSFLAAVALGAALLGLLLGLLRLPWGEGWCAATGLGALLALGYQAVNSLATTFHEGYLIALLLFVWAASLHLSRTLARSRRVPVRAHDTRPAVGATAPGKERSSP